jgi:hypothetical protein
VNYFFWPEFEEGNDAVDEFGCNQAHKKGEVRKAQTAMGARRGQRVKAHRG